jgi:1,2-diacylglycerol 3-beta-galactosyltransferase
LAEDQIRITGIPVDPALVNERRTQAGVRAELGLEPDRATLLAVGSKRIRKFLDPLRAINHSGLPLQLIAVAGGDRELLLQLQAVEWHLPTRVFGYVEEMSPLMRAADCLLSKAGGLIVSESLACGLPMLVVDVLPGQEDGNAAFVVDGGAGERGDNPIEVLEIMAHWMRDGGALLSQRAENAKRLGRPRAAFDVADLAWQAARDGERREPDRRLPGRNGVLDLLRRYGVSWSGALEPVTRRRRSRAGR